MTKKPEKTRGTTPPPHPIQRSAIKTYEGFLGLKELKRETYYDHLKNWYTIQQALEEELFESNSNIINILKRDPERNPTPLLRTSEQRKEVFDADANAYEFLERKRIEDKTLDSVILRRPTYSELVHDLHSEYGKFSIEQDKDTFNTQSENLNRAIKAKYVKKRHKLFPDTFGEGAIYGGLALGGLGLLIANSFGAQIPEETVDKAREIYEQSLNYQRMKLGLGGALIGAIGGGTLCHNLFRKKKFKEIALEQAKFIDKVIAKIYN